jgi:hypothetical protein
MLALASGKDSTNLSRKMIFGLSRKLARLQIMDDGFTIAMVIKPACDWAAFRAMFGLVQPGANQCFWQMFLFEDTAEGEFDVARLPTRKSIHIDMGALLDKAQGLYEVKWADKPSDLCAGLWWGNGAFFGRSFFLSESG